MTNLVLENSVIEEVNEYRYIEHLIEISRQPDKGDTKKNWSRLSCPRQTEEHIQKRNLYKP